MLFKSWLGFSNRSLVKYFQCPPGILPAVGFTHLFHGAMVFVIVLLGLSGVWSHSLRLLTMCRVPCLYF